MDTGRSTWLFRTLTGMHWIDAGAGSGRSGAIPGTSVNDYPNSVSPDGGTLAFIGIAADTWGDVYALSLKGEPQPRAIVQTEPPTKAAHSFLLMAAAGWRMLRGSRAFQCTCVHSPVPVGGWRLGFGPGTQPDGTGTARNSSTAMATR